jgi:short-subunit dehydrogenase
MKNLSNKTIWITGASGGIGEALAIELANRGARIILTARDEEKLNSVKAGLKGEGHIVYPMDLLKTGEISEHIERLIQWEGAVDMLINNAGVSQRSSAVDTALEIDRRIMELDYFAAVYLTKGLLPKMVERKSGCIVTITSVAGKLGTPKRSAYCAAKHALHGFMDSLRAEVHKHNIEVVLAVPGSIQTNISRNALAGDGAKHGVLDPAIANGMPVEECARRIVNGIIRGKEEILIAQGKEKLAVYLKRFWPGLLARMVRKVRTT